MPWPVRSRIAAGLLLVVGILVMGIGAYFAILRPAFLPEDLRFIGGGAPETLLPSGGTASWIRQVFVVLGGYAFATGLYTAHAAVVAIRAQRPMPVLLLSIAGLSSVGTMVMVNFAVGSDFRVLIAMLGALWTVAVFLGVPIARERA